MAEYSFKDIQEEILKYWHENKTIETLRKKNKNLPKFYFLQGPPYTSGKLHIGHAWNHALKDTVLRYKRMQGLNVWDRAGYDMHGLPTERKVMAKLDLKDKDAIVAYGLDKFSKECLSFSEKTAREMSSDLENMGITLDFSNAYMPITTDFIEGEWFLIKKAHEKKRLYKGKRTLTWCQHCETALAKHECEYHDLKDTSIYVKFKLDEKDKAKLLGLNANTGKKQSAYLLIWTTTPWTLTFNLAVMANPDVEYDVLEAETEDGKEYWIIAKALAAHFFSEILHNKVKHKIIKSVFGKDLENIHYIHPWHDEIKDFKEMKAQHPKLHTVVLSKEYVTTEEGTGLVHCAPGCGPEDYEVGYQNNLPAYNTITSQGFFPDSMGKFKRLRAKVDDAQFIDALGEYLVAKRSVSHDYAHCWRCKNPVVFRTTEQWFFKVEDLKEKMLKANKEIHWVPESGKNAFNSWLDNLRDNSISRQRFFGTPVPIWECPNEKCKHYEVIGSVDELKEKAVNKKAIPKSLHKPWIDDVKLECPKCHNEMLRVDDVLDVWIDSGTTSWTCLFYPQQENLFKEYFPADFICEGIDQIRGWYNLLMVASFLAFDKPCFKNVYMHGFVTDVKGEKMSKSLGNIISPYEVTEKYGVDAFRYYMNGNNAGEDVNFSWDELSQKTRNLNILWNMHNYLIDSCKLFNINPFTLDKRIVKDVLSLEEKHIFSKLNQTITKVTELFDQYRINETIKPMEEFLIALSRDYIKNTRDKLNGEEELDKELVLYTINKCLFELLKIFSVIAPFICEKIYLDMKNAFNLKEKSISHLEWPKADKKMIDEKIEDEYTLVTKLITAILAGRDKIGYGVRWPLKEAVFEILSEPDEMNDILLRHGDFVKKQCNLRDINTVESFNLLKIDVKPDFAKLGREFKEKTAEILEALNKIDKEKLSKEIKNDKKVIVKIGKETFELKEDMFKLTYEAEYPYVMASILDENLNDKRMLSRVYLNKERTAELDGEGYAREIARRVQAERKEAGLQKNDKIRLVLIVSETLKDSVEKQKDFIKNRCGAVVVAVNPKASSVIYENNVRFNVKEESITIEFNKV